MFAGHSDCLLIVTDVKIHLYGQLWLTGCDIRLFGFGIFPSVVLYKTLCLVYEDTIACLWLVLPSDLQCRVEIPKILIHADSFHGFSCLHELGLSFLVPLLVFELKGVL